MLAGANAKVVTLSTESIVSPPSPDAGAAAHCASCDAPLAGDQRYCLECGERRLPMSSVLAGGIPSGAGAPGGGTQAPTAPAPPGSQPPKAPPADGAAQRNNALTVIAGVGVLLLAMGVGVLIGRSGSSGHSRRARAGDQRRLHSLRGHRPDGRERSVVQQRLAIRNQRLHRAAADAAQPGPPSRRVAAAKSAAAAKGAKTVGALKAEEFASLSGGGYVIYSGVDHKRAEAEAALSGLKSELSRRQGDRGLQQEPAADRPARRAARARARSDRARATRPRRRCSTRLKSAKGKNYEEKSKALPDVVETG